jgi:hypothetical protein
VRLALALLLLLLSAAPASAATYYVKTTGPSTTGPADSCEFEHVRAAVNSTAHAALAHGDTVIVGAGTCAWGTSNGSWGSRTILVTKNIVLQGQGIGSTVINYDVPSGTGDTAVLDWTLASGNSPRLTGFTFGQTGTQQTFNGALAFRGTSSTFRMDNNRFLNPNLRSFTFTGCIYGVIDSNTFDLNDTASPFKYGGPTCDGSTRGDGPWAIGPQLGTANALYYENNTINAITDGTIGTYSQDVDSGGRMVIRYNTFNNGWTQGHAMQSPRTRGTRMREVYRNTYNWDGASAPAHGDDFRTGTGIFWGNTLDSQYTGGFVSLHYDRKPGGTDMGAVWQECGKLTVSSLTWSGGTATATTGSAHNYSSTGATVGGQIRISGANEAGFNGLQTITVTSGTTFTYSIADPGAATATGTIVSSSDWDENSDSDGYRCLDQPGAGDGDLMESSSTPTPTDQNQALEPIYAFANTGIADNLILQVHATATNIVVANRDFYNQTSSFNGTVGTGSGVRDSRPATCTTGVAWWATNANAGWNVSGNGDGSPAMDLCTGTNTWTNAWYVPYEYPHPLRELSNARRPSSVSGASWR